MSLPKGVVFDMDGTLLDTERIAEECFARACEQQDLPFHQSIYRNCIGQTGAATREILELGYGRAFDFDAFGAVWGEIYHATLQATPPEPKEGVVDLVTRLTELGVPLALATSSHRATVEMKLADTFLGECLRLRVCGDEGARCEDVASESGTPSSVRRVTRSTTPSFGSGGVACSVA